MMIATSTQCFKREFTNVIEGMILKNVSRGKPQDSHLFSLLFHSTPFGIVKVRLTFLQFKEVRALVVGATLVSGP